MYAIRSYYDHPHRRGKKAQQTARFVSQGNITHQLRPQPCKLSFDALLGHQPHIAAGNEGDYRLVTQEIRSKFALQKSGDR